MRSGQFQIDSVIYHFESLYLIETLSDPALWISLRTLRKRTLTRAVRYFCFMFPCYLNICHRELYNILIMQRRDIVRRP